MRLFIRDGRVPLVVNEKLLSYANHYHLEYEFVYLTEGSMVICSGD